MYGVYRTADTTREEVTMASNRLALFLAMV